MNLTNKIVFNKDLKSIDVLSADVRIKEIFVDINSDLCKELVRSDV